MRYIQYNFEEAKGKGLEPPEYYDTWEQYEEDSWEDLFYTNGIWLQEEDGSTVLISTDGGEPEDNSFVRDGAWIVGELNRAFQQGYKTGYNAGYGSLQDDEGVSP